MIIDSLFGYESSVKKNKINSLKSVLVCLETKRHEMGGIGAEGAAPPSQSKLETPIATCKVLGYSSCDVLHGMQPGNVIMWKVG